jgi:hypothetical protein
LEPGPSPGRRHWRPPKEEEGKRRRKEKRTTDRQILWTTAPKN